MKEFLNNKKSVASFKLGIGFIFFLIIFIICAISNRTASNNDSDVNVKDTVSFLEFDKLKDELINKDFKYEYKIEYLDTGSINKYNGTIVNGEDSGTFVSNNDMFNYLCKLDKCYKSFADHDEEYEFDRPEYIFPINIFSKISNMNEEYFSDNSKEVRTYNTENLNIKITNDINHIISIDVLDSNIKYTLNYIY